MFSLKEWINIILVLLFIVGLIALYERVLGPCLEVTGRFLTKIRLVRKNRKKAPNIISLVFLLVISAALAYFAVKVSLELVIGALCAACIWPLRLAKQSNGMLDEEDEEYLKGRSSFIFIIMLVTIIILTFRGAATLFLGLFCIIPGLIIAFPRKVWTLLMNLRP